MNVLRTGQSISVIFLRSGLDIDFNWDHGFGMHRISFWIVALTSFDLRWRLSFWMTRICIWEGVGFVWCKSHYDLR